MVVNHLIVDMPNFVGPQYKPLLNGYSYLWLNGYLLFISVVEWLFISVIHICG